MPHATLPPLTRRAFSLSLAGAGVSLLRSAQSDMHWALISDTHIPANPAEAYRGFKPQDNLRRIVPDVLKANPQGALVSGDVARLEGLTADYEAARALLQPVSEKMPLALTLGNHDHRANFLGVFGKSQNGVQSVSQKHVLVIESAGLRFIVLDSLLTPNSTPGLLGKAQRAWLATFLQQSSDLPTLLIVHHTLDDGDGSLLDAPRLFDILKPHRKVKAILYGHSHRYAYEMWEGVHLINLPAIGYNFNDDQPVGWVDARLTATGGAFTLRAIGGNLEKDGKTVTLAWRP
ncbi:MAG: metallophosphoesterase [Candidatus Solibacter sp.]|nr:metallophosphoesterase [Candidatus Solibacter sp.]